MSKEPTTQAEISAAMATVVDLMGRTPGANFDWLHKEVVRAALVSAGGVQKDAAELVHESPRVINYQIKTHGLDGEMFERAGGRTRLKDEYRTAATGVPAAETIAVAAPAVVVSAPAEAALET